MNFNTYTAHEFKRFRDRLSKNNIKFKVVTHGSSRDIYLPNGKVKNYPYIVKSEGKHLITAVRNDILNNFMPQHPDFDYSIKAKYKQSHFNKESLRSNVGRIVTAIDINDCYWFTAYKLGIITKNQFIDGLRVDEWKIGRNMSIGSLATKLVTDYYEGDKVVKHTTQENFMGGVALNNWVKNHVWDVFTELINILGDDYLMFYVDCIWVTGKNKSINDIKKLLRDKGYFTKIKDFEVKAVGSKEVELICIPDQAEYKIWQIDGADPTKEPRKPLRKYFFGNQKTESNGNISAD